MGWECKMTYSYVQSTAFGTSSAYSKLFATYKNESTAQKKKINSFWFYGGTGNGTFTAGDTVTGYGESFYMYVRINGIKCDDNIKITKDVYRTAYGNLYTPNTGNMVQYTFNFDDDDVIVDPGQTVQVEAYITAESKGSDKVLCMDRFSNNCVGGQVVNYVEDINITYNANGGLFTSNDKEVKTVSKSKGSIKLNPVPGEKKSYTITYDTNGGTTSSGKTSKKCECRFIEWNTKRDGSGTSYKASTAYNIQSNLTLYAQWENPELGSLPSCTRSDCIWKFWTATSTGTTKIDTKMIVSKNMTIYARWDYIIKYNGNGNTSKPASDVPANGVKHYNQGYTLDKLVPKRSGCRFSYWSVNKDGSGTHFNPDGTYTGNNPVTFYAQWGEPEYTVNFNLKGGTYTGGGSLTQVVKQGGDAVPPNDPTKEGYIFGGWSDGYEDITGSKTIYALWRTCPIWIMSEQGRWVGLIEYLKGKY